MWITLLLWLTLAFCAVYIYILDQQLDKMLDELVSDSIEYESLLSLKIKTISRKNEQISEKNEEISKKERKISYLKGRVTYYRNKLHKITK